jgi:hypothetical protein
VCTSAGRSKRRASSSCSAKRSLLGRRHVVEADLADRDYAVLLEIARQQSEDARASAGSFASFGLSAIVQKWRMPNWLARKRSHPSSDRK